MKIAIAYPPLESEKGIACLGQNRQFQWDHLPWFAYPMVPASAATLLKSKGHEVVWLDGIAEGLTYKEFLTRLDEEKPDLVMMETKTPVVKRHWKIVGDLKSPRAPRPAPLIVLVGDHVTALPEESMENSPVDYILTGGDYDFLLLNLCSHLTKGEKLAPGIWYRINERLKIKNEEPRGKVKNYASSGHFRLDHNLDSLPMVDRDLTGWELYAYENTNYKKKPGTYTMFGRDCWWGRCSFCSWTTLYPGKRHRTRSVRLALDEIGAILEKYPVREIMDDSGTFPTGDWLREFCRGMIERGYNRRVRINCNMRFNAGLDAADYQLMGRAGFRFLLFGLESANQKTLDRLNKDLKVEQIEPVLRWAKEAKLEPHITVMVGYPWEGEAAAKETLRMARNFFKRGLVDTMQATVVIPYPGTSLFRECQRKGWLKTLDWERYDMREPIMKSPLGDEALMSLTRSLYRSFLSPQFVFRKTLEVVKNPYNFGYYLSLGKKFFSKLRDFKGRGDG